MKYPNGDLAHIGDRVRLGNEEGIVVCSIDTEEYSEEHPKEQWSYLGKGVMVEFRKFGLIHYEEPENDLRLIARAKPS
ncbi:MAG: hypothetical protein ACFCBW_15605 [Candidatus Competibacterales bacterium]